MPQPLHFIAGLPRAGTTLLCNILAQNKQHYVSPTSGLCQLISDLQVNWKNIEFFKAQNLDTVYGRIPNLLKGTISGYYDKELKAKKIVFDKNRGWANKIITLQTLYGKNVKVVFPVRNVNEILMSFESKQQDSVFINASAETGTRTSRCMNMLNMPSALMGAINAYRNVKEQGLEDSLVIVSYADLCNNPELTLDYIHAQLRIPSYNYDFKNVKQLTSEHDTYHGFAPNSLHSVKEGETQPYKPSDYKKFLSKKVYSYVNQEFSDINSLAATN